MEHQRTNVLITRPLQSLRNALPLLPCDRFSVCPCPTIRIRPASKSLEIDDVFRRIPTFDFAIFTSQIAVSKTAKYLQKLGVSFEQFKRIYVCAVGPLTAETLNRFGIKANIIPHKYTAQALADLLPVMHTHAPKVLFPRGNRSSSVLTDELTRKGYDLSSPILYLTESRTQLKGEAMRLICDKQVNCIAFTSPSSVVALRSLIGEERFKTLHETAIVAAIGPITSAACIDAGAVVEIQPEDYTLRALAKEIAYYFGNATRTFVLKR